MLPYSNSNPFKSHVREVSDIGRSCNFLDSPPFQNYFNATLITNKKGTKYNTYFKPKNINHLKFEHNNILQLCLESFTYF